jgi:ligand-binding sensor protein
MMTPFDLKPKEQWLDILKRFAQQTGMTACVTDETGAEPVCHGGRFPLCAAIRDNPSATTFICSQTNTAMLAVVKKTRSVEIDLCEAGLLRVVVPIFRDDGLVGQVFACGLAAEDEPPDYFLIAKQAGMAEERVAELGKFTTRGTEDELRPVAQRLFEELNPAGP